jgi:RNA polymerase sigma factor (sigma-70 family)
MTPDTLPPEAMLEHAAWLRRLAASLVRNDGDADDLVQETWLAALHTPPREAGPAGGWLAEVLRNAFRMRVRSDGRRTRRETEAGRLGEQASPSPEVLLARVEAQRRLATLVTELAEPLRSTVLLRYFEGLSAADIARRQGVPAGTVRWRLKTGLDRLRTVLDAESGGDRMRWGMLLAPLGGSPDVARMTVWKGILIMNSATKVGVTVTAAALLVTAMGLWPRLSPAAKVPASAHSAARDVREAREVGEAGDVAAVPPAAAASGHGREARDQMRNRILDAIRKRGATAPGEPSPEPAAQAAPPEEEKTPGRYDPSYIQEHFREDMFPLLRQCYSGALLRQPKLAGKLALSFTIVGDPSVGGIVEDADFAEGTDIHDDEMRTCVQESLMTLTFDKPPAGGGFVKVTYPVAFAPGDDTEDAGER